MTLETIHPWEISTFLTNRDAVITTARDITERETESTAVDPAMVTAVARSLVLRIHGEANRIARAPHVRDVFTGEQDDALPSSAPDGFDRVRAKTRTTRTNRGETVELVTVHGRAAVQGNTAVTAPHGALTMSTAHASHVLATVPRATFGADAIDIYRATQALYGDAVPDLIGGDVLTWHEFATWDETRARTPRRGWQTRRRIPMPTPRNGEIPSPRTTAVDMTAVDVPSWEPATVRELIAGTGDPATAWIGHRLTVRPMTVREVRATPTRRITGAVIVRPGDDLARVLRGVAASADAGDRITWEHDGERGALTVTDGNRGPRFSVTGLRRPIRGLRTVDGLADAVARALAD